MQAVKRLEQPHSAAEKRTRTVQDTICLTPDLLSTWKRPAFQREIRVNDKVKAVAEEIRATKIIPGILTLGIWKGDTYIIDGQHRIRGFELAEVAEAYVDIRILYVQSEGEMADEFRDLNSHLVPLRPDDHLRALEERSPGMQLLRERCPYIGYDRTRRNVASAPLLSMATVLRCWAMATSEVPASPPPALEIAGSLTVKDAEECASFITACMKAWNRDYPILWGLLNLTLCAWLYRRLVLTPPRPTERRTHLDGPLFLKCLMELSSNGDYLSWLVARPLSEAHRGPGYRRVKALFQKRLKAETGAVQTLIAPEWAPTGTARGFKGITY